MKITGCVPLAGEAPAEQGLAGQRPGSAGMTANGLVARSGGLIALTDGRDRDPDRLLRTLTEVAEAAGDGTALVLAATRAALEHGGRPAWACAGITAGGDVAVLAYGTAVAAVSVDGGAEAGVSAGDSMIPVVRVFTGNTVSIRLAIGVPGAPDPRLRLDAGVVHGGGVLVTTARDVTCAACPRPDAPAARETARRDALPREAVPQDGVMTRSDSVPQDGVVPQGEVTLPGEAAGGGGAVPGARPAERAASADDAAGSPAASRGPAHGPGRGGSRGSARRGACPGGRRAVLAAARQRAGRAGLPGMRDCPHRRGAAHRSAAPAPAARRAARGRRAQIPPRQELRHRPGARPRRRRERPAGLPR